MSPSESRDEERREQAKLCFDKLTARGRCSCAGCDLDYFCPMAAEIGRWLFEEFLPAIDPTGSTFGNGTRLGNV